MNTQDNGYQNNTSRRVSCCQTISIDGDSLYVIEETHSSAGSTSSRRLSTGPFKYNPTQDGGGLHREATALDSLLPDRPPPRDKFNISYMCFLVMGATTLLPWSFFITATDYWMFKFRNTTVGAGSSAADYERTQLQVYFESYLSMAAQAPMLITLFVNTFYGQRFSQRRRIYLSLWLMLTIFVLTTIFAEINTDQKQMLFLGVTMATVVVANSCSGIFQAATYGMATCFSNRSMHAIVYGQALAGLLAVAMQLISLINEAKPTVSGLWYFIASTMFLAITILCYWSMGFNKYARYHLQRVPDRSTKALNLHESVAELWLAYQDCWQMSACTILTFVASIAVFPGVCVLVEPQSLYGSSLGARFFVPINTFLLFNLSDLVGRALSQYAPIPTRRRYVPMILSVARFVIPFLILFCNIKSRLKTEIWFQSDLAYQLLVGSLGLTNGYLFSSAMVMASLVSRKDRAELTGFIMATSLGLGLTLGSVTSNVLLRLI